MEKSQEIKSQDAAASRQFSHRVWTATLINAAMAGGVLLFWLASKIFLLSFAGVLLGIFLRTIADVIGRSTKLSKDWSLAVAILLLCCLFGAVGWLMAAPISNQVNDLSRQLPEAFQKLEDQLRQFSWGNEVLGKLQNLSGQTGGVLKKIQAFFSVSLEGVIDVWVIVFCGFYLAARPEFYLNGFLKLVPPDRRDRVRNVLIEMGIHLRHWTFGQIVAMTIIGSLTWLGLFLLGIPASEVLGVFAGLLDFVPVAGPWVAGIISCVIALVKSPMHAVYVACLFVGLHLLESHVVIPLVQKRASRLPPVLTILAMVLFYTLFGFWGLLLAVPLLTLILVAVRAFYVEDLIEHPTRVEIP
jgi:predicted PurR-regulated permease PerM